MINLNLEQEIALFARRGKFKDLDTNLYIIKQIQIKH